VTSFCRQATVPPGILWLQVDYSGCEYSAIVLSSEGPSWLVGIVRIGASHGTHTVLDDPRPVPKFK
jgi:hypothetical protein